MTAQQLQAFNSVGIFTCEQWLNMIAWLKKQPYAVKHYTPDHLAICLASEASTSPGYISSDVIEVVEKAAIHNKLQFFGAFQ